MDVALTNREADVMRVLRTLETKGYVGHQEEGRVHRYFAAVKQQAAQQRARNSCDGCANCLRTK
jgi:predicted transcriptional regulator